MIRAFRTVEVNVNVLAKCHLGNASAVLNTCFFVRMCFAVFCRTRPERVAEVPREEKGRCCHPVFSTLTPHGCKCHTLTLFLSTRAPVSNFGLHKPINNRYSICWLACCYYAARVATTIPRMLCLVRLRRFLSDMITKTCLIVVILFLNVLLACGKVLELTLKSEK